ncbi:MAG: SNF2 helicase associated domain-containing protein, partial [Citricoccus sp.]
MRGSSSLPYVADQDISRLVDSRAAERGKAYARQGAVTGLIWEPTDGAASTDRSPSTLFGQVQGNDPLPYETFVLLVPGKAPSASLPRHWTPLRGGCSCPVRNDCKHAAALLYAATTQAIREHLRGSDGPGSMGPGGMFDPDAAPTPPGPQGWGEVERFTDGVVTSSPGGSDGSGHGQQPADWRTVLGELTGHQEEPHAEASVGLGVELLAEPRSQMRRRWGAGEATVADVQEGAALHVQLRPLRQGTRDNWIKGGLTWKKFQYGGLRHQLRPDQVELLGQLYRLHLAERPPSHGYGTDETIRLDTLTGPAAWQLLVRAHQAGVEFVGQGIVSEVVLAAPGTVRLDVSGPEDDLAVTPVVESGGQEVPAARAAGTGGFVATEVLSDSSRRLAPVRLTLVPAAETVPRAVLDLLAQPEPLRIPKAESEEFFYDVYPRLSRILPVDSADGTVTFPEVPAPQLQLSVAHRRHHETALEWSWLYWGPKRELPVQHRRSHTRGGWSPTGYSGRARGVDVDRDIEHEDAVLETIRVTAEEATDGVAVLPSYIRDTHLHGADTARFVEYVLPELDKLDHVKVVEHGKRPDYRELTDDPQVRVTQVQAANPQDNDWFDLGFEITVNGQLIPFTSVFKALAQGKKTLLLNDGTYFSLDNPGLNRLRELISEAEAMGEWKPDEPRISKYDVALWEEFEDLAHESEESVAWRESVGALKNLSEITTPAVPAGLDATLRPYQLEGFAWMSFLYDHGLGGILADDMGLGKT